MRSSEFHGSHQEASCGARDELLNRGSGVRIPAPAPTRVQVRLMRHSYFV